MGPCSSARRRAGAVVVAALALILGGCLLMPGKFTSTLDLRKGGAFTFTYDGEIHLMALSKLAQMGAQTEDEFAAEPCYDEDFNDRDCTEEELAEQRRVWEGNATDRRAKREQEAEAARAMLGGIDPTDPAAADELVAKLRRQAGWKRVDHMGDGVFEVSFALAGRIDHDFLFPTMEGFPMANVFVAMTRRTDGTVRIDAPGFAPQSGGNPLQGMLTGMGAVPMSAAADGERGPPLPRIEGTFTIVTDGEILANNTDEGPRSVTSGRALAWTINARTKVAPTALVRID